MVGGWWAAGRACPAQDLPGGEEARWAGMAVSGSPGISPAEESFEEEGGAAPAPAACALRGHPRQLQAAGACLLRPVRLLPVPLLPQRLHLPRAQPQLLSVRLPDAAGAGVRGGACGRGASRAAFLAGVALWAGRGRGYWELGRSFQEADYLATVEIQCYVSYSKVWWFF